MGIKDNRSANSAALFLSHNLCARWKYYCHRWFKKGSRNVTTAQYEYSPITKHRKYFSCGQANTRASAPLLRSVEHFAVRDSQKSISTYRTTSFAWSFYYSFISLNTEGPLGVNSTETSRRYCLDGSLAPNVPSIPFYCYNKLAIHLQLKANANCSTHLQLVLRIEGHGCCQSVVCGIFDPHKAET